MATQVPPPQLAGLTFIEPIGTGGFADVYLYQQALPARRVAVKVLRETTDTVGLAQFHAEANVMAQLAGHPSIVPIYQADVSADGRAYLVMEYCPGPHLAQRFRSERLPVPEVLEVGVRIASAVETAHRAGILHRDIKPHNILTSAYGAPLLTDFGIASAAGDSRGSSYGMSVPWSPPEAFDEMAPPDVRSDVFSLGATVYSLLAGRSPFEIPGAANDSATLIHRIEHQDPSLVLRADVPDVLNQLLRRTMSRRLDDRPSSAMAFARAIQEVQIGLHLAPTRLEVMDASPERAGDGAPVQDARTEVKPISIIIPDEIAERGTLLRPRSITQVDDRTGIHPSRPSAAPDTLHRRPATPVGPEGASPLAPPLVREATGTALEEPSPRSLLPLLIGICLVVVIAGVATAALLLGSDDGDDTPAKPKPSITHDLAISTRPPAPTGLALGPISGDRVTVRWTNPDPQPSDRYLVQTGDSLSSLGDAERVNQPRVPVRGREGAQLCIRVAVVRDEVVGPDYQDCGVVP